MSVSILIKPAYLQHNANHRVVSYLCSVNCVLRWASYNKAPSCPQCKHPFDFLIVHRTLDGWCMFSCFPSVILEPRLPMSKFFFLSIQTVYHFAVYDFMFEESVCLLLRASWFVPLTVEPQEEAYEEQDFYLYDEYDADDDDIEEDYYITRSSTLHIGNRRWGDNGYIRSGRKEARPVNREQHFGDSSGGSSSRKNKEVVKEVTGRRAKRALKREAADKAAAAKHQQHLERLGRK
ncbi:hypothetical protein Taro_010320 [Colocasia esculenta]|uniref:Uncharacterized protein n=1 Tax=Colocasia esculenta TaxID=4460 RepID=A0A843U3A3_COLES|nr:hypothetical protein [Colocasia esculenta]